MFRHRYLVPRLVALLAVCLLIAFGLDPALRTGLERSGGSAVGARVEIARIASALARGSLYAEQVQIADPSDPFKNSLQFEGAWLRLDTKALAHRRVVVSQAVITGIEFDTERQRSGALEPSGTQAASEPAESSRLQDYRDRLMEEAGRYAEGWFDELGARLKGDLRREFQSPDLAEELVRRWQFEASRTEEDVERWQQRIEGFRDLVRAIHKNPLRHLDSFAEHAADLRSTQQDLKRASGQLSRWSQQIQSDKEAILAAKEHDLQRLEDYAQVDQVDPRELTEFLLGSELQRRLDEWRPWLKQGMRAIDLAVNAPQWNEQSGRGIDFCFGVLARQPEFLVERLAFSGTGYRGGNAFRFAGQASDLTYQPRRHDRPAVIEFATSGAMAIQVRSECDLRGAVPAYHLTVKCPRLVQPELQLGVREKFAVHVAPGAAAFWLDVRSCGDAFSGQLQWRQDELVLKPQLGGKHAEHFSRGLQTAFNKVDHLHASVRLSGSIDSPQWEIESNLGPDLSRGLQVAATQQLQQLGVQLAARLDATIAQHLDRFDQMLLSREASLTDALHSVESVRKQLSLSVARFSAQPSIGAQPLQ